MALDIKQIHDEFPLINHYGAYGDDAVTRASKTSTKLDEYKLIIRSLLILDVLTDVSLNDADADAANKLASGFPESEFGYEALSNPQNCVPNVTYLRGLLKNLDINEVIEGYIGHDLGKCVSFVIENGLAYGLPSAAAHDTYLDQYMETNPKLKSILTSGDTSIFIKILDLLGSSPYKLQAPGSFPSLKLIAEMAIFIKEYVEEIKVKGKDKDIETRHAINTLLLKQAQILSINTQSIQGLNPNQPYTKLAPEQQNMIAFLMWIGGLRLLSADKSFDAFKKSWEDKKNSVIVTAMTELLMKNLEQDEGYCAFYNPGGLLHKTDIKLGLKGFIDSSEKGGMGASMKEVVEVAFPFILAMCHDPKARQNGVVGHNEFQVIQLLEIAKNTLLDLGEITVKENSYPHVNFGTIEMNQALEKSLNDHRLNISIEAQKDSGIFSTQKIIKKNETMPPIANSFAPN